MPRHQLWVGPSAAARRRRALEWLGSLPKDRPALVVSTELGAADDVIRDLTRARGSVFGIERATLDGLAYRLALPGLARGGLASYSRLGQEAVTARVVHQASRDGRLGALASVAGGPGLVRALTSTLNECRLHDVAPRELTALGPEGETLSVLLTRHETMSREQGVADRATVLTLAAEAVRQLEAPTLLLDVVVDSTLTASFVAALAANAELCATVPQGDDESLDRLERALGVSPRSLSPLPSTSPVLRDLQRFVFGDEAPPPRTSDDDVVILSAPGEAQEAVEIARAIHQEAGRGTPFDRMAVLLRAPESYTPHLEDAFRRAGIPAYFENGTLRPDPAGRAFLALLDRAAEELSASRFAEYLSLSQLPRPGGEEGPSPPEAEEEILWAPPRHALAPESRGEEPVQLDLFAEPEKLPEPEEEPVIEGGLQAPWRWEKLLVDAAVIGGRDRWERRLLGLSREVELRIDELDPDSAEADTLRHEQKDLKHLRLFALPLIERLDELPGETSWGRWLEALEALASAALAYPMGVLALLKELHPMEAVGPVGLLEVREVLAERLTLLSQQPSDYRFGKVWVAPIESARGTSFDVVLVPGLAERMFPRKIVEDPLLLDADRVELGRGLPLQRQRIADERLRLRLAIGAAERKIVFSYPSIDLAKGRAKVPSFYLLEVARASQGELPDFETLEREAASSSGARLGWPAPRERARAVDATEFDLAFLSDSLRRDTSEKTATGTGRYLIDANPALARSLRNRYQRGRRKFTAADGFIEPSKPARTLLERHRLEARAYSVTALEKYAACPYRFYLNAVLRLRPRETAESATHLDALTRGKILHDAQFHTLGRLEEAGELPVRQSNLTSVLRLFEIVFDEVEDRFREELAPPIERIWKDELERIRFDLRGWLRREALREDGYVPYRREFTFGMRPRGPADPASTLDVAELANGLRLRGAIDLVERREDGKVRVTDHKSGKVWMPESAILNGGESLQPILYTLAYEALTGEEVDSARLYYCSHRGGYAERVVRADEESLSVVAEFQRRLDDVISHGFFPASPKPPLGCRYCDYLPVCGPRMQIDAKRKEEDPRLSPLNWLRSLT